MPKPKQEKNLTEQIRRIAGRKDAAAALGGIAFLESTVLPIPPDALLIPMSVMRRDRALRYAALTTILSVAGGVAGYFIGAFLMEVWGSAIIRFYGLEDSLHRFQSLYANYGILMVLIGGFTPIPYKVITLTAGAGGMNLPLFILASLVGRGARFFLLSLLCRFFGGDIEALLQQAMARSGSASSLFWIVILAGIGISLLVLFLMPWFFG